MLEINYLGHLLKEIENVRFSYICKNCGIKVWIKTNDYLLLDNDLYHIGKKIKLTCDEVIIKNIIE